SVRVAPVDHVHVQAQRQQAAHQRAVLLQVDHVGTVDQGVDDQQRRAGGLAIADEAVEHGLAVAPDLLPLGGAVVDLANLAQHAHAPHQAPMELHRLLGQRQRIELQRPAAHRPRPPRRPSALASPRLRLTQSLIETTCAPVAGCAAWPLRARGVGAAAVFAAGAGLDVVAAAALRAGFFAAAAGCATATLVFFAALAGPARFAVEAGVLALAGFASALAAGAAARAAAARDLGVAAVFTVFFAGCFATFPPAFFGAGFAACFVFAFAAFAVGAGLAAAAFGDSTFASGWLAGTGSGAVAAAGLALRGRFGAVVGTALAAPCFSPAARRSSRTVRSSSATLRCTESTSVRPGRPSSSLMRSISCCRPLRTRISALVRAA